MLLGYPLSARDPKKPSGWPYTRIWVYSKYKQQVVSKYTRKTLLSDVGEKSLEEGICIGLGLEIWVGNR